jgi:hypothetical protein
VESQPLVDKVVNRLLPWKGQLMHHSGQVMLIKTTLVDIPVYTTIAQSLPQWLLNALVNVMKAFLWSSIEVINGGKFLVIWRCVQFPIQLGGLGIPNLKLLGMALKL